MNTQKVAITIPTDVLAKVDAISKQLGFSRSKYISILLDEKLSEVIENQLKESYDRVFADDAVKQEQVEPTGWSAESWSGHPINSRRQNLKAQYQEGSNANPKGIHILGGFFLLPEPRGEWTAARPCYPKWRIEQQQA
jgi:hypothetical protein